MRSCFFLILCGVMCPPGHANLLTSAKIEAEEPPRVPVIPLERPLPEKIGEFPVYLIEPLEIVNDNGNVFEHFAGTEFTFDAIAGDRYRVWNRQSTFLIDPGKLLPGDEAMKLFTDRIERSGSADDYAARGRFHAERNQYSSAFLDLSESLQRDPDNIFTLWARIAVSETLDHHQVVLTDCTRILKLFDDDVTLEGAAQFDRGDLLTTRGIARFQLRQFEPALIDFDESLKRGASRFWIGQEKARTLNELSRYDESLKELETVLTQTELEFYLRFAKTLKGRTLMLAGRYQEAIELLDALIGQKLTQDQLPEEFRDDFPEIGDVQADENLAIRGRCLLKLGNVELAARDLDAALELAPWNTTALQSRAELRLRDFEVRGALEDIRSVLAADEQGLEFQKLALLIQIESGLSSPVIAKCSRLLEEHGKDAELFALRARAYLALKNIPFALGDADRAVRADPEYARGFLMRGAARMQLKQRDLALDDFNRAVELAPGDYLNYAIRAHYWEETDREKCVEELTKCIEAAPRFPHAYFQRGLIYKNTQRYELAANDLEKYLSFPLVQEDRTKTRNLYFSLGTSYKFSGNYPKAIEALSRSINHRPPMFMAYRDRGECYYELGEFRKALDDYDSFQKKIKGSPHTYYLKSQAYLAIGQPEAALKEAELCLESLPAFGAARLYRGLSLLELGRIDEAREEFEYLLATHPDSGLFRIGQSRLLEREDQTDEALAELTKAIELAPERQEIYWERARLLARLKRHDEAARDFSRLFELNPWNAELVLKEARRRADDGRPEESDQLFDLYSQLKPDKQHVVLLHKSRIAIDAGDLDRAFQLLGESLKYNPRFADAYYQRAHLAERNRKFGLALADFDQLILLQPENIEWEVRRSVNLNGLRRFSEAIAVCDGILARSPQHSFAFNNRGVAREQLGELELAIADYSHAIAQNPIALSFGNRGRAYLKFGEYAKGVDDLERAVALAPDHAGYLNQLAWTLATNPDDSIRDGKDAVEFARRSCQASNFKFPNFIDTLAAAHAENGEFDKAVEFQKQAISLLEDPATIEDFQTRLKLYESGHAFRESPRLASSASETPDRDR